MSDKLAQAITDAKREGWHEWIRSEADEQAVLEGCWFDQESGERVCRYFAECLRHTMSIWAGQPFVLLPYQRDEIVMPLFGWRRADNTRRYRKGDIFIAKKAGKSTLVAGLGLFGAHVDGEIRPQVYIAAFTREQTANIYGECSAMVRGSPVIAGEFNVRDSNKRILCPRTGGFIQALAGEAGGVEGVNAHYVLFDEIHVQKDDRLWKALTYAKSSRPQPMTLSVSTVGVADKTKIWWDRYEYCRNIIEGRKFDSSCFAFLKQADAACLDSWEMAGQREQWLKANPGLGVTIREDTFREDYIEATNSPVMQGAFLRYRLNVPTTSFETLLNMSHWDACGGVVPDLSGRRCYGGMDLADTDDIAAFVLFFPGHPGEQSYLKAWFWCPKDTIQRRIDNGSGFYDAWKRDGRFELTADRHNKHSAIEAKIRELAGVYDIQEIGYDPWNAGDMAENLSLNDIQMVKVSQTIQGLALGTKRLIDGLADGTIRHSGDPVFGWMARNATGIMNDNGDLKPSKKKSSDKIDGIVAAVMAIGRAALNPDIEPQESYYETHTAEFAG